MGQKIIGRDRVYEELKTAIASALGIDASSIQPESVLTHDLDAESLDFLDISYHLEQVFGCRMARHFVLEHAEEIFGEGTAIDENGCLTPGAVKILQLRFKGDRMSLKAGMDMEEVVHLITVESMLGTILDILDTLPESCPQCSRSSWKTEDGTRIICGSCGAPAAYKAGDDLVIEWLKRMQEKECIF